MNDPRYIIFSLKDKKVKATGKVEVVAPRTPNFYTKYSTMTEGKSPTPPTHQNESVERIYHIPTIHKNKKYGTFIPPTNHYRKQKYGTFIPHTEPPTIKNVEHTSHTSTISNNKYMEHTSHIYHLNPWYKHPT